MTDIMKLADDYAQHKYVNGAEGRGPDAPEARTGYARAALQSAIEALQKEVSTLDVLLEECKMDWSGDVTQIKDEHKREIQALQSQLDAMGKGEPVQFLCDATRFKVRQHEGDVAGRIFGLPRELNGRWVALVAADDDCHLKLAAPKALAPLTDEQILEAIRNAPKMKTTYAGWVRDQRIAWGRAILAAAHGIGGTP